MARLTAIVTLLCLALSCVQAKWCDRYRRSKCVKHHLCDVGFNDFGDEVDLRLMQSGNQGCTSTEKCCPVDKIVDPNTQNLPWMNPIEATEQTECGRVNKKGISFTLKSADGFAQENELPWMVVIRDKLNNYLGGGSLIALNVVLTAHHTTKDYRSDEIIVRAGEWDFKTRTEVFPYVEVGVRKIVRYPSFDRRTGTNNIALLFLTKPFVRSRHIGPICLPSSTQRFDGRRCIVSGWGKDAVEQNSFMTILKKVDLPVVSSRTCERQLTIHKGPTFKLHDSWLCAGGEEGKDACFGDGGSPLACQLEDDPDRFEQAGIVNWGIGCGQANTPAVYTDVAKFRNWIDEQIAEEFEEDGDEVDPTTTVKKPIISNPFDIKPTDFYGSKVVFEGEDGDEGVETTTTRRSTTRRSTTRRSTTRRSTTRRPTTRTTTRNPDEIDFSEIFKIPAQGKVDNKPITMVVTRSK
ncbi:phenoloxidase-activating factor 2-like [Drosophila kikkawai]|uniref:Phenoloxidase-activating factor 2-like n=1 Tax=Drosophila kikkawai TaxID=30033 RepID=A0ABM4GA25_DROKI